MRGRLVARAKRWITLAGRGLVGRHRVQGRVIGEANAFYCLTIPGLTGPYWPVRGRPAFTGWAIDLTTGRPLPMRATLGGREMARERLDRPDLAAAIRRIAAPEGSDCGLFSADRGGFGLSAIRAEIACPERGWITVFRCLVVGLGKGTPEPSTPDPSTSDPGPPDPTIPWRYRDWRERADDSPPILESPCRPSRREPDSEPLQTRFAPRDDAARRRSPTRSPCSPRHPDAAPRQEGAALPQSPISAE